MLKTKAQELKSGKHIKLLAATGVEEGSFQVILYMLCVNFLQNCLPALQQ